MYIAWLLFYLILCDRSDLPPLCDCHRLPSVVQCDELVSYHSKRYNYLRSLPRLWNTDYSDRDEEMRFHWNTWDVYLWAGYAQKESYSDICRREYLNKIREMIGYEDYYNSDWP